MAGNSQRKGAVRKRGKGNTAGSGGRVRRGLEGKGPTPKAEDRPYHAAYRAKKAADRAAGTGSGPASAAAAASPESGPEWVIGRNSVLEALEAEIPTKTAYVAEGAERDDRLRDILKLAAERSLPMLEVTRVELDRLVGGGVHQGVALQLPEFSYAHPDDLLAAAIEADGPPLIVALDSITDPRNLGAIIRSAAAFGAHGVLIPERRSAGMTAAAWKTSAGAAAKVPIARATNLTRTLKAYADAGLFLVGLDGEATSTSPRWPRRPGRSCWSSAARAPACPAWSARPATPWPPSRWRLEESLNAGVAAGIALYEISRRR